VTLKRIQRFKEKYHPEDSESRFNEQQNSVKSRREVFDKLVNIGILTDSNYINADINKEKDIIRFLDSAVIFMEDGTEEDLKVLGKSQKTSKDGDDSDDDVGTGHKFDGNDDAAPGEEQNKKDNGNEDGEVKEKPVIRKLHQTTSIFFRSLPPTIARLDIINLCKNYPGFLRAAFSQHDNSTTGKFMRRGWVTFAREVNIKDICWKLNTTKVKEESLNPVLNRDLSRRVRAVSGIAQHTPCARVDLRNVTQLIERLDSKWKVWMDNDGKNPYMMGISEYLVDELSEDEVEAEIEGGKKQDDVVVIKRDEKLLAVLDKLLFYLRVVHSVDYYNAGEYPNEFEMPNRCGIFHARGPVPPNQLTRKNIDEFVERFKERINPMLNYKAQLTEDEMKKMGPKDEDEEVEKFIKSNTQELETDKWLCPLSGKKFKGPEYIRKHIQNKHKDKLDQVRVDVKFFNNYLKDPRRPGPPSSVQPSITRPPITSPVLQMSPHYAMPNRSFPARRGGYTSPPYRGGGQYNRGSRGRSNSNIDKNRGRVGYQDLDAPDVDDLF